MTQVFRSMDNQTIIGWAQKESRSVQEVFKFLAEKGLPQSHHFVQAKPTKFNYSIAIGDYHDALILRHLGATFPNSSREFIAPVFDLITAFYCTNWFEGNVDQTKLMCKDPGNNEREWFTIFAETLLLSLLADEQRTLRISCDWVESWMDVDTIANPPPREIFKLYLSVADSFRQSPMDKLRDEEEFIRKSRKKRPRQLFKAWEAARMNDQLTFESSLRESTTLFVQSLPEPRDIPGIRGVFALPESMVLAAARKLGMNCPDFGPQLMARILTAESVGLSA